MVDLVLLVEIDRDDALIDDLFGQERGRTFARLADVVEDVVAVIGGGGRRAQRDQHLLLARSGRYLFQRHGRNHVAVLGRLGDAAEHAAAAARGSAAGKAECRRQGRAGSERRPEAPRNHGDAVPTVPVLGHSARSRLALAVAAPAADDTIGMRARRLVHDRVGNVVFRALVKDALACHGAACNVSRAGGVSAAQPEE